MISAWRHVAAGVWLALASAAAAAAQEAVVLIRHAEKDIGSDPGLTEEGRARAAAWARMLQAAELDIVIHTDAARTRETGEIVADVLGIATAAVDRSDIAGLIDRMAFDHGEDRVLVVAHSETLPRILRHLGAEIEVTIAADDYSNIFVVTPDEGGQARVLHLRMP